MEQLQVLQDLAVIFAGSLLVILLFHRIRLPFLPGFIVAGVALGPNGLGLIPDVHRVQALADVGVILLLFTIGLEFSLARLREMGRQLALVGITQVGTTVALATLVGLRFLPGWRAALFAGFLVALSSTAIVLKLLTDKGDMDTPSGRLATGMLIFQDLCVVPMMLVVPFLAGTQTGTGGGLGVTIALGKAALLVVGVLFAARTFVPRALALILATRSRELFLIAVILVGILTALGTAAAGASLALGAFLAGLVISESDYAHQALAELMPLRDLFMPLFFVAVGMLVQLDFILRHPIATGLGIAAVMSGKTIAAALGPAAIGYAGRVALQAGLAVSQIGEFSFVLAESGRAARLLPDPVYQAFLAVSVPTMLVTPFLLELGPSLLDRIERAVPLDRLLPGFRPRAARAVPEPIRDHVIIAGYGLNGRNLAAALRAIGAPFLIVELNSRTVREARRRGEPAFYGDATRDEILRQLGAERAKLLVIAISDAAATRRIVRIARSLNPALHIIARTRYVVEIPELERLGANVVIPEEFETSIEIFARVLVHYGVSRSQIEELVGQIRASHYQALRSGTSAHFALAGTLGAMPRMSAERIRLPAGAPAIGRSLAETGLRTRTGALVLSVSRGAEETPTPEPSFRFEPDDELVVVGQPHQIEAARLALTGTAPASVPRL